MSYREDHSFATNCNVLATRDVYSYLPSRFYMEMQCLMNYRFGPCETCLSPLLVINC